MGSSEKKGLGTSFREGMDDLLRFCTEKISPIKTKLLLHPQEMKEHGEKRKRPKVGDGDEDDTEQASGVRKKVKGGPGGGGGGGRGGMKKRGGGAWRGGR